MILSTDREFDRSLLSLSAKRIVEKRDIILDRWLAKVRSELRKAKKISEPILTDTLPVFLDYIAQAISPNFPRSSATEQNTIAEEHGGERARLTDYQLEDLIAEYQLLHEALVSVLEESGAEIIKPEFNGIASAINCAIREASTTFALVNLELREHFAATLTHDLRNPLNSISMAAELLREEQGIGEEGKMLISRISENAKRMDRMIQDLLDVTYARAGGRLQLKFEDCNAREIIEDIVAQMKVTYKRQFQIFGSPVKGCWDQEALKRALENLITNAIKYGDPQSVIKLSSEETHGRCIMTVHNKGNPIPIEDQETIFQAFRRSNATQAGKKGWGIGLALVRAVAEAHGESMGLDSSFERGTTFIIDIPCDARPYSS